MAREGACLRSCSSSFQSLGPRKDIAFCPFLVFRSGSERSVPVFLSSVTFRVEFLTNKLERYSGTRPFRDLYMLVAVSLLIISLIVGQFKLRISAIAGVSNLLFVTILAPRFCNFCRVCSFVAPTASPHRTAVPKMGLYNAPIHFT